LSADERGSVISVSDSEGASLGVNSYDEFGMPAATNLGRFGYTGQMWIGSAQLYYYKARMYAPQIGGRFLQPDPIGYASGPNLYAYVLNDPVNFIDPLGLDVKLPKIPPCQETTAGCAPPTGTRIPGGISPQLLGSVGGGTTGFPVKIAVGGPSTGGLCENGICTDIVVTVSIIYLWVDWGYYAENEFGSEFGPESPFSDFYEWVVEPAKEAAEYCASVIDPSDVAEDAAKGALFGATRGAVQGYYFGFLFKTLPPGSAAAAIQAAIGGVTGGVTGAVRGTAKSVSEQCAR